MSNELMMLAGEIAKKDPEFERHVVDLFEEFFKELNKAMDGR